MKTLIILVAAFAIISAQGPGNGISKSTWGASDPLKCLDFVLKYLPAKTSGDSCTNGKCECATQGRAQVNAAWQPGPLNGFGIHAINCTYHPYGSMSLKAVEDRFDENFNGFESYHPYMDFNAGFWMKHSLVKTLIDDFLKDGVKFLALKWTSGDNNMYYSITFQTCGMQVLEVITDTVDPSHASLFKDSVSRFNFAKRNNKPSKHNDYLTPIKISRATASLDAIKKFYVSKIGAKMIHEEKFDDGSEVATFMFDLVHNGVQLQFWQGRKAEVETNGWTVKQLEDQIMSTHRKIMVSPVCGFDQFIDNHYAIDMRPDQSGAVTEDVFVEHFKEQGLPYHWWSLPGGMTQVYGMDPTGWGIQVDSTADNPPSNMPNYSAACKSTDGCTGQGNCNTEDFLNSLQMSLEFK